MGSKGSTTTQNQQQSQSYAPTGAGYLTNALDRATSAANQPFAIPQAPVAGFSNDQQQAFQGFRNAQGMAQPYYNQASGYYSPQGAQDFLNPYASSVMANLKDVFGQQTSQNTGKLTQAAGGIGADRIAVGQAELAKQQGLVAGQTLSGMYDNAVRQAQSAGQGQMALGQAAQGSALQGASALYGAGNQQQQLEQQRLNSPYQQQLAQAAFPYQQAQFLSGITGALAPGLGGTTSGYSNTQKTAPGPSLFSQILGGGTAAVGALGGTGAFGSNGWMTGKGGDAYGGNGEWGGSSQYPLAGLSPSDYGPGYARGGRADPYAIDLPRRGDGSYGYDEGGAVSDDPIDISGRSIIPNVEMQAAKPVMPQLNFTPMQEEKGSGSGGKGGGIGDVVKLAGMFINRGGRVNGYAAGGDVEDDDPSPATFDERFPYRMPDAGAMDAWRANAPSPDVAASPVMAFSGDDASTEPAARAVSSFARGAPSGAPENPYSVASAAPASAGSEKSESFASNPWAALMAAGLGIMGGTSPFAGVNIGQGGLQGLKVLEAQRAAAQKDETVAQAARRLDIEAKHHEDQYTRMTPYQKALVDRAAQASALEEMKPVKVGTDLLGRDIMAKKDPKTGQYINIMTGKPVEDSSLNVPPTYNIPGPQSEADAAKLPPHARLTQGVNAPEGVRPEILAQLPPQRAATIKAIDEGRQSLTSVPLRDRQSVIDQINAYDPNFDQTVWTVRNQQQRDMSTNGNAGKMILAVNQLLPHLKTASDKAQELENSNYPAANTIKNWLASATGDPRVKKFETVREVAAMDAARLLRGSGAMAEQDIDFWRKNIGSAGSPAQLQETIALLADDLMGARISSIQQSYRMNMRMEPPEMVDKHAKEALESIKTRVAKKNDTAPQQTGEPPAAAATAGPKVGERKQFRQGWGRWDGKQWVPEQ